MLGIFSALPLSYNADLLVASMGFELIITRLTDEVTQHYCFTELIIEIILENILESCVYPQVVEVFILEVYAFKNPYFYAK